MLGLTRSVNESIIITTPEGHIVRVCIAEIRGRQVRIGVDAPRSILIDREEVFLSKAAAK